VDEGWYLMSPEDLEIELKRWREPGSVTSSSNAQPLSTEAALAHREKGNLPDALGRSLRLVIHVPADAGPGYVEKQRARFEPDFHDAPTWRREGSKPINVVPLRAARAASKREAWWDDPEIAALEQEWRAHGTVAGMNVPGEYRSFVYKTVVALRAADKEVTARTVSDSVARWLGSAEAEALRTALEGTNPQPDG
jgi:hypothetical protein